MTSRGNNFIITFPSTRFVVIVYNRVHQRTPEQTNSRTSFQYQTEIARKPTAFTMATVVKMSAFPVASELFSKKSLWIPLSARDSPLFEMLSIALCFLGGLYIAIQMYSNALSQLDTQLPRAFAFLFCAAYLFQLFIGYLEHKEEQRWREATREQHRI